MQSLLLFAFLLLAFFSISNALNCYYAGPLTDNSKPNNTRTCNQSVKMCIKQSLEAKVGSEKIKGVSYGCDDEGDCTANNLKSGKCISKSGISLCCCDLDLCNSSRLTAIISTALLPFLVKLFH